jgi:hypothetical protein
MTLISPYLKKINFQITKKGVTCACKTKKPNFIVKRHDEHDYRCRSFNAPNGTSGFAPFSSLADYHLYVDDFARGEPLSFWCESLDR